MKVIMHMTHLPKHAYIAILAGLLVMLWILGAVTPPHTARGQNPEPTFALFLPLVQAPGVPTPELDWYPRLDQRGAVLIPATVTPGQGYWRLVRGVWYNTEESQGKHHIFVDTLDETGVRQTDVPVLITWSSGAETLTTQAKPDEEYAADFAMFSIAPSYKVQPGANAPADIIDGLGMGEIDDPSHGHHTSYGLVWQWTVATAATPTPSTTPSIVPTTPPTLTTTPIITATPTASVTPMPTATPTSTLTFPNATVSDCTSDNSGSRFGGVVVLAGSPVDGQRVVFSYEIDGPWVTEPAITGPNPPGAYSHIISAGFAKAGNWVAWVVATTGERISAHAEFATDGPGGVCNVATIHFSGP